MDRFKALLPLLVGSLGFVVLFTSALRDAVSSSLSKSGSHLREGKVRSPDVAVATPRDVLLTRRDLQESTCSNHQGCDPDDASKFTVCTPGCLIFPGTSSCVSSLPDGATCGCCEGSTESFCSVSGLEPSLSPTMAPSAPMPTMPPHQTDTLDPTYSPTMAPNVASSSGDQGSLVVSTVLDVEMRDLIGNVVAVDNLSPSEQRNLNQLCLEVLQNITLEGEAPDIGNQYCDLLFSSDDSGATRAFLAGTCETSTSCDGTFLSNLGRRRQLDQVAYEPQGRALQEASTLALFERLLNEGIVARTASGISIGVNQILLAIAAVAPPSTSGCFGSKEELKEAIYEYIVDPSENTSVAETYGWPIGTWCVSSANITDFSRLFYNFPTFDESLNGWDTSLATEMKSTFEDATAFNGNISTWKLDSVKDASAMFLKATAFNSDISDWEMSACEDFFAMFQETNFSQDLSRWNVSSAVRLSSMFEDATKFESNLTAWDVSRATLMGQMFKGAKKFDSDLSSWQVDLVTEMDEMFEDAEMFNADLSGWQVGNVVDMEEMFNSAKAFNQSLCNWTSLLPTDVDVDDMFDGSGCAVTDDPDLEQLPVEAFCSVCI